MGKTFNINIESLIDNLHISCIPEDSKKMKKLVTDRLKEALIETISSDKSGCFRVSVEVLTKKILDGLEPGNWGDNEKHIRRCLTQNWFYTKDDMISFASSVSGDKVSKRGFKKMG